MSVSDDIHRVKAGAGKTHFADISGNRPEQEEDKNRCAKKRRQNQQQAFGNVLVQVRTAKERTARRLVTTGGS